MEPIKTGTFISELRKEKNLTQISLSEKLNVSNRAVSRWENGEGFPDVTLLPLIADALDVTVDELLAGERIKPKQGESLFINEYNVTEKDLRNSTKAYYSDIIPIVSVISFLFAFVMGIFTVINLNIEGKSTIITVFSILMVLLLFVRVFNPILSAKIRINDAKTMSCDNYNVSVEFADKINFSSISGNQEINYESISGVIETKELIVIKFGRGHYSFVRKDGFVKGDVDEFKAFINSKIVPNKNNTIRRKLVVVLSVVLIMCAFSLIPLNIIGYSLHSEQYNVREINSKAEYFNENKIEFERALNRINSDEKIKEEVEEDGYASYDGEDFIALDEILYVDVGEGYVGFSTYVESDCLSGYVYYDKNNLPYPYEIGYDHGDIENKSFNYISDDDLYLLGKSENNNSYANEWYLVKILDDNWYFYEYY